MSRTSAAKSRKDGAVTCNAQLPRGRCNKLVLTPNGDIRCPNGHLIGLDEARRELLQRPDAGPEIFSKLLPRSDELLTIIHRYASSEFTTATVHDWQSGWMFGSPAFFSWLLSQADQVHSQAATILRDAWEKKMSAEDPLLDRYFKAMWQRSNRDHWLARERVLSTYGSWFDPRPRAKLNRAGVYLEICRELQDPLLPLYELNLAEAWELVDVPSSSRARIYFVRALSNRDLLFDLQPDPHCTQPAWLLGTCQIQLSYGPRNGIYKWYCHSVLDAARFRQHLRERFSLQSKDLAKEGGVIFSSDETDHIIAHCFDVTGRPMIPSEHSKVVQKLRNLIAPGLEHILPP